MLRKITTFFLAVLFCLGSLFYAFAGNNFELVKNLELFVNIFSLLNTYYVDDIDPKKMTQDGIEGMLQTLDPYSAFISEDDLPNYRQQTTGKYGGIGAIIRQSGDYVIVADPYEGFPAVKAGLIAGDKILKINNKSAKNLNTREVSKLLKGLPGTPVELLIERYKTVEPLTIKFNREEIKINSVPFSDMLTNQIGYIRLNSFTENCHQHLLTALAKQEKEGLKSLILDLRGNPGGLLNESVDVANIFIPKDQEIVSTRSKEENWDRTYTTERHPEAPDMPLVILIDGNAASASEIVAGVMQDIDRAVIIGERSFGKGLVQTTKDVGYSSKVKLTTAKYYLPSGRCIQAVDYSGGYNNKQDKIADSLRTKFKTQNGRNVYDAGGIDPDKEITQKKISNVTRSLIAKELLFQYANEYRHQHDTAPEADQFELTDTDFENFRAFLADKDYEYETESEMLLKKLKEMVEKEQYLDDVQTEIDLLEQQIEGDKQNDLVKFKEEIRQLLEYEIIARYHYQEGRIAEALEDDEAVKLAIEVLKDNNLYKQMLNK